MRPTRLRCNLLTDPLAIADARPRLSWVLEGAGLRQTAYRIEASSSEGGKADLWDSGKVASDSTFDIEYDGATLKPRQTCFWRVTVWDENGSAETSNAAEWTAAPEKWEAEWIGFDAPLDAARPPDFVGTFWIWHAEGPLDPVPVCTARFRKRLSLRDAPTEANLLVTGDDSYVAYVNGAEVGRSDGNTDSWRRPGLHDVTKAMKAGENTLEVVVHSIGVSVSGLIAKLAMEHGPVRSQVVTDAAWEARWEESSDWRPVRQLGEHGMPPWGGLNVPQLFLPPPRVLSRKFSLKRRPVRAVLYATALGLYEIVGVRNVNDFFAPGWTDYRKRLHYRAHELTGQILPGENELQVTLSDGWFAGYVGFGKRHHYGEHTRFSAMLWLDYEDGTSQLVSTDENWRAATGPITQSDFLMGESYDARITELDWHPVVMGKDVNPALEPYPMDQVREGDEYSAVSVTQAKDGDWVFDLGANFAGFVLLHTDHVAPGQTLTFRHAEMLNPDGTVYTTNLRSARATDSYTGSSAQPKLWYPIGSFHGFRYVSVNGLTKEPSKDMLLGVPVSNVTVSASRFKCSDARLNKLWQNIERTFRSNFIEIPTDCPQRDERLGWTGDIEVFCRTAMLLADVQPFLDKWLVDIADAQRADGQFPMVAPVVYDLRDGGPAWADAGTIVPWALWEVYADKRVLQRQYESMKRFVGFCTGRLTEDGYPPKEFHCFGDWLNVGVETPHTVLYMLFLARSVWIVAQTAQVLGYTEDWRAYSSLFRQVCTRFRARYMDEDGWVEGKSQTGQALALSFGVVGQERGKQVFARLVEDIEQRGHLTTGFIGTKDLMLVLRDHGRTDLAYRLLLSEDYPGWLFSVKQGATSIWERWDGWTPEKGFQDPGMNSFAHYAFGAVGQFMMETIGGIRLLEPGYQRALIAVEPGPLQSAQCSYDSPRGRFETSWEKRGDRTHLRVVVPPNVEAAVRTPQDDLVVGAGSHEFVI